MSKKEQIKNEQLMNIKTLSEFEHNKLKPFIKEYDNLRYSIDSLCDSINVKRTAIKNLLEKQANIEYEQALKEMSNSKDESLDDNSESDDVSTLNIDVIETEEIKAQDTITQEDDAINKTVAKETKASKDTSDKKTVEESKDAQAPKVDNAKSSTKSTPKAKAVDNQVVNNKPLEEKIPELRMKSRPKNEREKAIDKSRIFIPDNTTKPSGQPINNRFANNNQRTRRPNQDTRPFNRTDNRPVNNRNNSAPDIKAVLNTTPAPKVKDNRVNKKKDNKKHEEVKKTMDKRTLIRRGFIDNKSPGAIFDYDRADNKHYKARKKKSSSSEGYKAKIENAVVNSEIVSIKVLSERIGQSGAQIIKQLFLLGIVKTINESIDYDTAELVANELGVTLELKATKSSEDLLAEQLDVEINEDNLKTRPPVVTIMGHVDHGKTSVLDYIRKANVADGEAGGITQHIGAYTVDLNGDLITFLDTPGHEAFTSMRLRGAQATDIAVIVVAADDGIMPQSIEAIAHAKASNVPIIIAINKMDKHGANPERIKQQLTEHDLLPEEWGGETICVPISAATGDGIDKLLEAILLLSEIKELKADYDSQATGIIIEAQLDKGKGPVATVLVQGGTLSVSDYIVAGTVVGKIRAMLDDKGKRIKSATASMPVQIQGFNAVPQAGDLLVAVKDEKFAKKIVDERKDIVKSNVQANKTGTSLEDIFSKIAEGDMKDLNVIIKADVQGSVEAIKQELTKLTNEEVRVTVVQASVGAVSESDIMLAESSGSIVIAFNVRPDSNAKKMAERNDIDVRIYRIIYDIINDINLALKGMLKPKFNERIIGRAEVRATFKVTGSGTIAGCYVIEDSIQRNAKARLLRDNVIVYEGNINSLKRHKDDAKEVAQGYECGISIEGFNDIKESDIIEAYVIEEQINE